MTDLEVTPRVIAQIISANVVAAVHSGCDEDTAIEHAVDAALADTIYEQDAAEISMILQVELPLNPGWADTITHILEQFDE